MQQIYRRTDRVSKTRLVFFNYSGDSNGWKVNGRCNDADRQGIYMRSEWRYSTGMHKNKYIKLQRDEIAFLRSELSRELRSNKKTIEVLLKQKSYYQTHQRRCYEFHNNQNQSISYKNCQNKCTQFDPPNSSTRKSSPMYHQCTHNNWQRNYRHGSTASNNGK